VADLQAALEEHLAGMGDADWAALCARVRPPADPTPEADVDPKQRAADTVAQYLGRAH
jgi:hypothetical protein